MTELEQKEIQDKGIDKIRMSYYISSEKENGKWIEGSGLVFKFFVGRKCFEISSEYLENIPLKDLDYKYEHIDRKKHDFIPTPYSKVMFEQFDIYNKMKGLNPLARWVDEEVVSGWFGKGKKFYVYEAAFENEVIQVYVNPSHINDLNLNSSYPVRLLIREDLHNIKVKISKSKDLIYEGEYK